MRTLAAGAFAAFVVTGCGDPPCATYWETLCGACDPASCELAKDAARTKLGEEKQCQTATARLEASLDFQSKLTCGLGKDLPANIKVLKERPWTCNDTALVFEKNALRVGGRSYEFVKLDAKRILIKLSGEREATCGYELKAGLLHLECAAPLHELGTQFTCKR